MPSSFFYLKVHCSLSLWLNVLETFRGNKTLWILWSNFVVFDKKTKHTFTYSFEIWGVHFSLSFISACFCTGELWQIGFYRRGRWTTLSFAFLWRFVFRSCGSSFLSLKDQAITILNNFWKTTNQNYQFPKNFFWTNQSFLMVKYFFLPNCFTCFAH